MKLSQTMTRYLPLLLLLAACDARSLDIPGADPISGIEITIEDSCCQERDGLLVCRDDLCGALTQNGAAECTTLSNTHPTYCQDPLTNDCVPVYLEHTTKTSSHAPFQTVWCF
jgi:hypothetical protein